jgi:hypothetical protein
MFLARPGSRLISWMQGHPHYKCNGAIKFFRDNYERIIPEIASPYSINVLYFRSDQISTEEMVDQILQDNDLRNIKPELVKDY